MDVVNRARSLVTGERSSLRNTPIRQREAPAGRESD
jgi:hypothetical protein